MVLACSDGSLNPICSSRASRSPLFEPEQKWEGVKAIHFSRNQPTGCCYLDLLSLARSLMAVMPEHTIASGISKMGDGEDDDSDSSVGSSIEDDDDGLSLEDDDVGLSVGTELALELARWEVEWAPEPEPTEEEKAVEALHIARCLQFTEYDPKLGYAVPNRFCQFNISLFDFEKESMAGLGPPLSTLSQSDWMSLEESVNLISLKIIESDMNYPINIFGTVLARDQVDYKCIYLFRRGREDAQEIKSAEDMLTLMGPHRGLAITSSMFFEINLKIKGDDGDKDFSKGLIEHCATNDSHSKQIVTRLLTSWMSTIQLVYTAVPFALEATLAINILKGASNFTGKVTAWTTGNENQIILHDSQTTGIPTAIGDGGSIVLSRYLIAVPVDEELVLSICVHDGDREAGFELTFGHSEGELICKQGLCELSVKVTWTCMLRTRRHKVFEKVGCTTLVV